MLQSSLSREYYCYIHGARYGSSKRKKSLDEIEIGMKRVILRGVGRTKEPGLSFLFDERPVARKNNL